MTVVGDRTFQFSPDEAREYLREQYEKSSNGLGRLVMISGGIASGKTTILTELLDEAANSGAHTLSATGAPDEQSMDAGLIDQMLTNCSLPIEVPSTVGALLRLSSSEKTEHKDVDDFSIDHGDSGSTEEMHLIRGVCDTLLNLARERPVVIGVDDLHFADALSLRLLLQLQRRIRSARILLIFSQSDWQSTSYRPLTSHFSRHPQCHSVRLTPVSERSISRMLGDVSISAAQPAVSRNDDPAARIHALSGGNPLFARALVDDYGETEPGYPVTGPVYTRALYSFLSWPDTRLMEVTTAVAVLGGHSGPELISKLTDIAPKVVADMLEALDTAGLLESGKFRHPGAGTAVLSGLSPAARARLHQGAAELKHRCAAPAAEVAHHLLLAEDVPRNWAVPVLRQTAEQAIIRDDTSLAIRCLELALSVVNGEEEQLAIRQTLVRARWRNNPSAVFAHTSALRAAASAGNLDWAGCFALMRHAIWQGDRKTCLRVYETLSSSSAPLAPQTEVELRLACQWHFGHGFPRNGDTGETPAAEAGRSNGNNGAPASSGSVAMAARNSSQGTGTDHAGNARAAMAPSDLAPWKHTVVSLLGGDSNRGGVAATVASAERILQNCRLSDTSLEALATAITALLHAGRTDRAESWCTELATEAQQRGAVTWQAMFEGLFADLVLRRGDPRKAAERARASLDLLGEHNWGVAVSHPLSTLLLAQVAAGDLDEASRTMQHPLPEETFDTLGGLRYLRSCGHFHLAAKRPLVAISIFRTCQHTMRKWGMASTAWVPWRSDLAEAHLQLGNVTTARDLARQETELAAEDPYSRGLALRVLAFTSSPSEGPTLLNRAAKCFEEAGHQLELEGTIKEVSRLPVSGRPSPLGLRLSQHRQSQPVTAVSPRTRLSVHDSPRGDDSTPLSEAELRVAQLAALGHTNRQISGKLFITVSTVEQHLTRAYRKLGIPGRSALADELHGECAPVLSKKGSAA